MPDAMASGVERGASIETPAPPTGALTYAGRRNSMGIAGTSGIRWPAGSARWRFAGGGALIHKTAFSRLNPRAAHAATHGCVR